MQPPTNPLIAAAVRPLSGNAEQRLAAIAILSENADPEHPRAAEVISRWEKIDSAKRHFIWKSFPYLAALLIAIPMVAYQVPDLKFAREYRDVWDGWEFPEGELPEGLTADERLLLGDPSEDDLRQKEALWFSDPENPAFYAEYASAYRREFGKLPDDYLETVSRIAPRNSYFLYGAAGLAARGALDQKISFTSSPQGKTGGIMVSPDLVEDDYVILDETAFGKSLSLLEKASSLPEYETYWTAMREARQRALPAGGTYAERINKAVLISRGSAGISSISSVTETLCARAQQLSRAGDKEGFLALAKIRAHLIRSFADSPDLSLLNELMFVSSAAITAQYFHHAAKRLGLDEMSDGYLAEFHALRASSERRRVRGRNAGDEAWMTERGSPATGSILGFVFRLADSPPPLAVAHLAPARYADHALMMRGGFAAIAVILIPATLLVFLFRFAFPSALRKTAARLTLLLRPFDWAVILLFGTVFPIAAILALQRFTDTGGREWAVNHFQYLFPSVHLVSLLILVLLTPVFLIRWRLSKRIAPLHLPCRPGILSILAMLAAIALPVAAYPIVLKYGATPTVIKALAAVPALWFTAILWSSLQVFIGKATNRITLAATSMALLPACAVATILISLTLPIYRASEENWLAKDTIQNFHSEPPEDGLYELRLATQKRKETRAILGMD